ncbi:MAG: alpha/beta hydrolase [Verrucomicrobia bacterium]|nr:alpha/beta hydrolase [Verrucomicrobiota bacterium]MBU1735517.1 alpha/beta hydrolase [Verrucomicrobiota bacterium]MBU1855443.1 alpha/beta hydrolase [Verrucomicrobiota bacterium]
MEKSSIHPLSRLFAKEGMVCFCPNYRLLQHAAWPAGGKDCLKAADFLEKAVAVLFPGFAAGPLIIAGMSAGGHLALTTGLSLSPEKVKCIISIAGPSDLKKQFGTKYFKMKAKHFFGKAHVTEYDYRHASPISMLKKTSPPLFCLHSVNDELVPPVHSYMLVKKARKLGLKVEDFLFNGNDCYHGIWENWTANGFNEKGPDLSQRKIIEPVRIRLRQILASLN